MSTRIPARKSPHSTTPKQAEPRKAEVPNAGEQKNGDESGGGLNGFFCRFATQTARYSGSSITFAVALSIIVLWALTGPLFRYSDTWQLVINTGTTIITFLMVFLIQNTQNRDSEALHLKIDELIRSHKGAQNALINLEDLTQEELDAFKEKFAKLAEHDRADDPNPNSRTLSESPDGPNSSPEKDSWKRQAGLTGSLVS